MPSPLNHATVIPGPWPASSPASGAQPGRSTAAIASGPGPSPGVEATTPRPASARTQERRKDAPPTAPELLRAGLTPPQLVTLEAMEIFRWRLAFVRRPLFQAPIPVLFDQDNTRHVVIREDGTLDEQPMLKLRG